MKYDVDYFIDKFEKIPARKWFAGNYHNDNKTKFCVLGHCGESVSTDTREAAALKNIFCVDGFKVAFVNDGEYIEYPQKTPRSRILSSLRDIKKGKFNKKT